MGVTNKLLVVISGVGVTNESLAVIIGVFISAFNKPLVGVVITVSFEFLTVIS